MFPTPLPRVGVVLVFTDEVPAVDLAVGGTLVFLDVVVLLVAVLAPGAPRPPAPTPLPGDGLAPVRAPTALLESSLAQMRDEKDASNVGVADDTARDRRASREETIAEFERQEAEEEGLELLP